MQKIGVCLERDDNIHCYYHNYRYELLYINSIVETLPTNVPITIMVVMMMHGDYINKSKQ